MKTTVYLGNLPIEIEVPDGPLAHHQLVRRSWAITRLNVAATNEGWDPKDCVPFSETGNDNKTYSGFIHLPTGQSTNFGLQTEGKGGDWFVREGERYKPPFQRFNVNQKGSRQLPQNGTRNAPPPPARTNDLSDDLPATDAQNVVIGRLATKIFGFDDWDSKDLNELLDSHGYPPIHKLSAFEAGNLIKRLQQQ